MTLKFEFINHSCFTVTYKDKSLTVDPWLEGSVFNKSWNLLIETPAKSLQTVKKSEKQKEMGRIKNDQTCHQH